MHYSIDQRLTVRALGLGKIRTTAVQEDNPTIRGMIHKVEHLVKVEEVEA
jgi:large subunit ribosomal protein L30